MAGPHREDGTRKCLPAGGVRVGCQHDHRRVGAGEGIQALAAHPVQVGGHQHRVGPVGPHALQKAVGGETVLDERDVSGGAEIWEEARRALRVAEADDEAYLWPEHRSPRFALGFAGDGVRTLWPPAR
jgi:hypothetical protein